MTNPSHPLPFYAWMPHTNQQFAHPMVVFIISIGHTLLYYVVAPTFATLTL